MLSGGVATWTEGCSGALLKELDDPQLAVDRTQVRERSAVEAGEPTVA